MDVKVFCGAVVFAETEKKVVEYDRAYVVVKRGKIEGIYPVLPEEYADAFTVDYSDGVMIPAFSDLHVHAPQYPQRGIAMDELLYDWLHKYTFPLEERYADPFFAESVYEAFCNDLISHGTMNVAVYGTIHEEGTGKLIEKLESRGIRAFVGKINMDVDCPQGLCETVDGSLFATERFLEKYGKNRFARPILTPRFAPTCSRELLYGLGRLAKKYEVGMQTHLVESLWEAEEATRRFPDCSCDAEIYEKAGLLGYGPFIGAHFIFPSEDDIRILQKYDGFAVQCPDATTNVIAGIMRTGELLDRGIKLGLGSDVAAGQSLAVYTQAASAVRLSKIKSFYEKSSRAIMFEESFYMATKGGGRLFGKTGSFEKGYSFDALVLKGVADGYQKLTPKQVVERFCYAGERENIRARFLRGEELKIQ